MRVPLLLLPLLLLCGCPSGSPTVEPGDDSIDAIEILDASRADANLLDRAVPEDRGGGDRGQTEVAACEPGNAQAGCSCAGDEDCATGSCTLHFGSKVCAAPCAAGCPEGWECGDDDGASGLCSSLFPTLCLPCFASDQCGENDALCALHPDATGAFCGAACDEFSPCPAGWSCKPVDTIEGEKSHQCIVKAGTCLCSDYAVDQGLEAYCETSNELGACAGLRQCVDGGLSPCDAPEPQDESCDGLDNDCDGEVDEETTCDDGDACTEDDYCDQGECTGQAVECDDGDLCTTDSCLPESGCSFEPNELACEEDGDPCTEDVCVDGACSHPPGNDGMPCDDLDDCTTGDHCFEGACIYDDYLDMCKLVCSDGLCIFPENPDDCPEDCGPCGDGVCGFHENGPDGGTCPMDCLTPCGDGLCEYGESPEYCVVDCGGCGDGLCGLHEDGVVCPNDCPPACGNAVCEQDETIEICTVDCIPPCGDGLCVDFENPYNCPTDCSLCDDGVCGISEDQESCPQDCMVICGNGLCEGGENPEECAVDCGWCGDGVCGFAETGSNCPADCFVGCGDNLCGPDEDGLSCPLDCTVDADGDGFEDLVDNCPWLFNPEQINSDNDASGDMCDLDDDNDGDLDASDCAPLDPEVSYLADEQCDGVDNDCDDEVDNEAECAPGLECLGGDCICPPDCEGKECGPDGCDGECGQCPEEQLCLADGSCLCVPDCVGKGCGDDGCEGSCGECTGFQEICLDFSCVCSPDCEGKECGSDGCGGQCGQCDAGVACDEGLCVACVDDGSGGCDDGEIVEFPVSDESGADQRDPAVATLSGGGFVVSWTDSKEDGPVAEEIYARVYGPSGQPLAQSFLVNSGQQGGGQFNSTVTRIQDGTFAIGWDDLGAGAPAGMRARGFEADGTPVAASFAGTNLPAVPPVYPAAGEAWENTFVMVWQNEHPDTPQRYVYILQFDTMGILYDSDAQVSQTPVGADAKVALSSNGIGDGAIVAWGGDNTPVQSVTVNWAGTFGGEIEVSAEPGIPSLAPLPGGGHIIAWADEGGTVAVRRYSIANTPLGPAVGLSSQGTGASVATVADGTVLVAWAEEGDGGSQILYSILPADGGPATVPVALSSADSLDNSATATAAFQDGNRFVVVWESNFGGDQGWDISAMCVSKLGHKMHLCDPCGDGVCGGGETCESCEQDCGPCSPGCGDNTCGAIESPCSCPADCGLPCENEVCGDDGCGGSCGLCPGWQDACTGGQCICQINCEGKECGADGCGGECGDCPGEQMHCVEGGVCQCFGSCGGNECGDDGCGESCGECPDDKVCHPDGYCDCPPDTSQCDDLCCPADEICIGINECCKPNCTDKECGDDGCGSLCGECQANLECDQFGKCRCNDFNVFDWDGCKDQLPAEVQVNDITSGCQREPAICAVSDDDLYVAVWSGAGTHDPGGIYGRRFTADGLPTGGQFHIGGATSGKEERFPDVSCYQASQFVTAYQRGSPDDYDIYLQRMDITGNAVDQEQQVNVFAGGTQELASVAVSESGGWVVAWQSSDPQGSNSSDGSDNGIYARFYNEGEQPFGPEKPVNAFTNGAQEAPSAAALADGTYVIAWSSQGQMGGGLPSVILRHYDHDGSPSGGEISINAAADYLQLEPAVSATGGSGYVVTYAGLMNLDRHLFAQRYNLFSEPQGLELQLSQYTGGEQGYPAAAGFDNGAFVVAWHGEWMEDTEGFDVAVRGVDQNGQFPGNQIHVNTKLKADQHFPDVAVMGGEGFATVWESDGQDGDACGVFLQTFGPEGNRLYGGNCESNCNWQECGNDGCWGSCGTCQGVQEICLDGECACQPACEGKLCGPDGCGGECGQCLPDGFDCTDDVCNAQGQCEYNLQAL